MSETKTIPTFAGVTVTAYVEADASSAGGQHV